MPSPQELVAVLTGDGSYLEGDDETSGGSGDGSGRLPLGRIPTAILAALDCAQSYAKGSAAAACLVAAGWPERARPAFLSVLLHGVAALVSQATRNQETSPQVGSSLNPKGLL